MYQSVKYVLMLKVTELCIKKEPFGPKMKGSLLFY